jgi:beta-lactam-binding protein with PASTA domain
VAAAGAMLLAGCGAARPVPAPDVTGQRLDVAESNLDTAGLDHRVVGGGVAGVVLRSRWQVCAQDPRAGVRAVSVTLAVARVCDLAPRTPLARAVLAVTGENLDAAEAVLQAEGLGYRIESDDEIVVRSRWIVCDQDPAPGEHGRLVELYVARDCDDW